MNVFEGELVRNNTAYPETLKVDRVSMLTNSVLVGIPGTGLQFSYNKDTDLYYFPIELLTPSTLGVDCNDLDEIQKSDGTWYPDFDRDGYHDINANATIGCVPPGENYILLANSLGPDCDDSEFIYNVVKTWYHDEDGDGYFVDILESCHDPGWGWSLTSTKNLDDNDNNPFSPVETLDGTQDFIIPSLITETTDENGNKTLNYGGKEYLEDDLVIHYRGATLLYKDLIFDRLDPDILLDDTNLVLEKNDVIYGATISGTPINESATTSTAERNSSNTTEGIVVSKTPTPWINQIINENEGFSYAFGDVKPESNEQLEHIMQAFNIELLATHAINNKDLSFHLLINSYQEKVKSNGKIYDEIKIKPLISKVLGPNDAPIAVRIDLLQTLSGRIEFLVSINDDLFKASETKLASHLWKNSENQVIPLFDEFGNWLNPTLGQTYNQQVSQMINSRIKMAETLIVDHVPSLLGNINAPPGLDLAPENFPNYDHNLNGWLGKLIEVLEISYRTSKELRAPEGIWNPMDGTYLTWNTKIPASIAGYTDRSLQDLSQIGQSIELLQSFALSDSWSASLMAMKTFNLPEMAAGLITEGRANLSTLQGSLGLYEQYHALGGLAKTQVLRIKAGLPIGQKSSSIITAGLNAPSTRLQSELIDFQNNFNQFNSKITTFDQFRSLNSIQQDLLVSDLAQSTGFDLRNTFIGQPSVLDSWQVFQIIELEEIRRRDASLLATHAQEVLAGEAMDLASAKQHKNALDEYLAEDVIAAAQDGRAREEEDECNDRSIEKFKDTASSKYWYLAFNAALIEKLNCETEEAKWDGSEHEFTMGFLNALIQEFDGVALFQSVEDLEALVVRIQVTQFECLKESLNRHVIGETQQDPQKIFERTIECTFGLPITPDNVNAVLISIRDYIEENIDDPYERGQATYMILSLVMPTGKVSALKKSAMLARLRRFKDFAKIRPVANRLAKENGFNLKRIRGIIASPKFDDFEELIRRLNALEEETPGISNKFFEDFGEATDDVVRLFGNNPQLADTWAFLIGHPNIRRHIASVEKIADLLADVDFIKRFPNGKNDLNNIIDAVKNPLNNGTASKLVSLPDHLENIRQTVKKHFNAEGFDRLLVDLKNRNFHVQDGATHMLNDVKNYPEGSIRRFDYEFDGDGVACKRCRFDVELTSGPPRLIEYKSWSLENIKNISSRQLIEYFRSANSIDDIRYIFNKLKTPNVNLVKSQVKDVLSNNIDDIFEAMPLNAREDLLGIGKGDRIDLFEDLVNDTSSRLYNFIVIK